MSNVLSTKIKSVGSMRKLEFLLLYLVVQASGRSFCAWTEVEKCSTKILSNELCQRLPLPNEKLPSYIKETKGWTSVHYRNTHSWHRTVSF